MLMSASVNRVIFLLLIRVHLLIIRSVKSVMIGVKLNESLFECACVSAYVFS